MGLSTDEELQLTTLAFEGIVKIVQSVLNAKSGALDPAVASAAITAIGDQLAANNATIDAEITAEFHPPASGR